MKSGLHFTNRDIISIRDFTREEIDYVLNVIEATDLLAKTGLGLHQEKIMASNFTLYLLFSL